MARYTLFDGAITAALTAEAQTPQVLTAAALALTLLVKFALEGVAGTSITVRVQTSLDGGVTWYDVAAFGFTNASATKAVNLSGLTPVTTPPTLTSGSMASGSAQDGILGDRFRVLLDSVGAYGAGSTLQVEAHTR